MAKEYGFIFLGNFLCIDFINTEVLENGRMSDLIPDFTAFMNWLVAAHVMDEMVANRYIENATLESTEFMNHMFQLRKSIRLLFESFAKGSRDITCPNIVEQVNSIFRACLGFKQLVIENEGFKEEFVCESENLIHLLLPIAESLSDMLQNGNRSFIKHCENPNCVLFFYDVSKNHSRRWCSMSTCGNRVKVGAHYWRQRNLMNEPSE